MVGCGSNGPMHIRFDANVFLFNSSSGEKKLGEAKGWDDLHEPQAKKKKHNERGNDRGKSAGGAKSGGKKFKGKH